MPVRFVPVRPGAGLNGSCFVEPLSAAAHRMGFRSVAEPADRLSWCGRRSRYRFAPRVDAASKMKQLAQTFGLCPADGDFDLGPALHPQMVAGLEPWNYFLDPVDIH